MTSFEAAQHYLYGLIGDRLQEVPMSRQDDGSWAMRYDELWPLLCDRPDAEAINASLWVEYDASSWWLFADGLVAQVFAKVLGEAKLLPFPDRPRYRKRPRRK